jgi:hypothetical protein
LGSGAQGNDVKLNNFAVLSPISHQQCRVRQSKRGKKVTSFIKQKVASSSAFFV